MLHTLQRRIKNSLHYINAMLACAYYRFPAKRIRVIGVTGTDGKTTTSHLIYHILTQAGRSTSVSTTVYADIAGDIADTGLHVTTQHPWAIQQNIAKAVEKKCEFFVQETTSHGIDQHRVTGIDFDTSVITNITPEHLDYHKTFEAYQQTKTELLLRSKHACLNKDATCFSFVAGILESEKHPFKTFSVHDASADYVWPKGLETTMQEEFNKQNIMAAYAVCRELGLTDNDILPHISTFALPKGRFDTVYDKQFKVLIDFAHTPNSIRQLLSSCQADGGRTIHVFGSAGLRDSAKRPDMGRASGEYADLVVVTEEDYRTEDFMNIAQAISAGLYENGFVFVEPHQMEDEGKGLKRFTIVKNREKAIDLAILLARKGDTVLVTGKGHEQSLARGKKEYPWDDYKGVELALRNHSK